MAIKKLLLIFLVVNVESCLNSSNNSLSKNTTTVDCNTVTKNIDEFIKNYSLYNDDKKRLDSALIIIDYAKGCSNETIYLLNKKKLTILMMLKNYHASIVVVDSILKRKGVNPRFIFMKGVLLVKENQLDSSAYYFKTANEICDSLLIKKPTHTGYQMYKIYSIAFLKGRTAADVELNHFIEKNPNVEFLKQLKEQLIHFDKDSFLLSE